MTVLRTYCELHAKQLVGEESYAPSHIAVGDGLLGEDSPPYESTELIAEIARAAITSHTLSGPNRDTVTFLAPFAPGMGTGTWREIGLIDAAGRLLTRDEDSETFAIKGEGDLLIATVTLRIAGEQA